MGGRDQRCRHLECRLWRRLQPEGGPPAGTAPQAKESTANAVHGTYDIAGATVEDNTLWRGKCILFDNGPRLRVEDNPAIENADRITIEAWVNTLSWPTRAVVCRKNGSYILYNYSGGFSWYLFGPDSRLQHDIAGALGNGTWGYIVGTYDKDVSIGVSISTAPVWRRRATRSLWISTQLPSASAGT